MTRTIPLAFPVELPGGRIDAVTIDLDRRATFVGRIGHDLRHISRITALPPPVLGELAEFDYLKILLAIEEMNAPRLAAEAAHG